MTNTTAQNQPPEQQYKNHPILAEANIGDILTLTPTETNEIKPIHFRITRPALDGCAGEEVGIENGEITWSSSLGTLIYTEEEEPLMSNNHNEPRVYLNGKPYDFSEFYVSDDFLDAWLAEETANNSNNDTESVATSTGKPLQPGDYIPGEVREAFGNRIGLGDVVNTELPVALDTKKQTNNP